MSATKLCLVDGTYELFRQYFGAPSRRSPAGQEVGAAVALGRSLASLARSTEFSHFAVAFDTTVESFRNDLFEGYKTGEGIDPELLGQFPLAEEVTRAMGLHVLSMVKYEADDGLASAAAQFRSGVDAVVIASPDKDLTQCVRPGVSVWDRMRDKTYHAEGVVTKMGVVPKLVPDYLALVGDTADGIPGVPRWGAKSAAKALSHFGRIEDIPREESKWDLALRGRAALVEQLRHHEEEVLLYRTLATLVEDVDLGVQLDDLRFRGPENAALAELSQRLGVALQG